MGTLSPRILTLYTCSSHVGFAQGAWIDLVTLALGRGVSSEDGIELVPADPPAAAVPSELASPASNHGVPEAGEPSAAARQARLGGELPHDPASFARPAPEMGEVGKVEPVRRSMSAGPWSEVHMPRPGRMECQPVFRKTLIQGSEHAFAILLTFEGDDKVIRMAHEPEGYHLGPHRPHHPRIQRMNPQLLFAGLC